MSATFLPLLDYDDVLYMHAPVTCLRSLDTVYHCALRFVTGCKNLTHHCTLYKNAEWSSLSVRRFTHWLTFIYKALLGMVPFYLGIHLVRNHGHYSLRSTGFVTLTVPRVFTELRRKAFRFAAPSAWNSLQDELNLSDLIPLESFVKILKTRSYISVSFTWLIKG